MNLYNASKKVHQSEPEKWSTDFQTPPDVCDYMVGLLPRNSGIKKVLEPTPGIGNLTRALQSKGFSVTSPSDFFLLKKKQYDAIVMNPPFSSRYTFMENAPKHLDISGMKLGYFILTECMAMSNNIIALMPWFTISDSDLRLRLFKEYGLKSLTTLPRKTFNYARIQTVIIELEKGFYGQTLFHVYSSSKN